MTWVTLIELKMALNENQLVNYTQCALSLKTTKSQITIKFQTQIVKTVREFVTHKSVWMANWWPTNFDNQYNKTCLCLMLQSFSQLYLKLRSIQ